MSNVTLAASAGFCFGVKRAIEMAYAEIEKNNGAPLYSYGSLIHNKEVTRDLDEKGLHIIESLDGIDEGTVVIRSHGVGRFLYDALEEKGMRMVDGTCPFVKKIHTIVNEAWNQGKSIIIAGDGKHPEVQGINGWCGNQTALYNVCYSTCNNCFFIECLFDIFHALLFFDTLSGQKYIAIAVIYTNNENFDFITGLYNLAGNYCCISAEFASGDNTVRFETQINGNLFAYNLNNGAFYNIACVQGNKRIFQHLLKTHFFNIYIFNFAHSNYYLLNYCRWCGRTRSYPYSIILLESFQH